MYGVCMCVCVYIVLDGKEDSFFSSTTQKLWKSRNEPVLGQLDAKHKLVQMSN